MTPPDGMNKEQRQIFINDQKNPNPLALENYVKKSTPVKLKHHNTTNINFQRSPILSNRD